MRIAGASFLIGLCLVFSARADLTIVQKIEGAGKNSAMTIKIKGDKARIETSPNVTTILDRRTGDITRLMNDQKTVVRISGETMKAAAETMNKLSRKDETTDQPKLTPTGRKEIVNGYQTEEYVYQTPKFKVTYWIALKYPNGAAILKQLQVLNSQVQNARNKSMPDYSDFPGLPIKTVVSIGGRELTTTLTAINQAPISDSEFTVPKDYREMKMPGMPASPREEEQKPATTAPPAP